MRPVDHACTGLNCAQFFEHLVGNACKLAPQRRAEMNAADFRRIALTLDGTEEGSHMGAADFRVGGHIFATLAHESKGYGNLMLTPERQAEFVAEAPRVFVPVAGGWGRNGATHVRLAVANEELLRGALQAAWRVRVEKNGAQETPQAKGDNQLDLHVPWKRRHSHRITAWTRQE